MSPNEPGLNSTPRADKKRELELQLNSNWSPPPPALHVSEVAGNWPPPPPPPHVFERAGTELRPSPPQKKRELELRTGLPLLHLYMSTNKTVPELFPPTWGAYCLTKDIVGASCTHLQTQAIPDVAEPQSFQKSLTKEYTLSCSKKPYMIYGLFLISVYLYPYDLRTIPQFLISRSIPISISISRSTYVSV